MTVQMPEQNTKACNALKFFIGRTGVAMKGRPPVAGSTGLLPASLPIPTGLPTLPVKRPAAGCWAYRAMNVTAVGVIGCAFWSQAGGCGIFTTIPLMAPSVINQDIESWVGERDAHFDD
jgi:hypothetical protein